MKSHTYNLFSLQGCGAGAGTGPWLGLCGDLGFLLAQAGCLPAGSAPFHVTASSTGLDFGPYPLPPMTVHGVCPQILGLVPPFSVSPVETFTVR